MKTLFSLFTLFFLPFAICWGEVIPTPLIADSMVLQQKSKVRLWGTARSQTRVTARCSWLQREIVCQSDAGGRWEMQVETPAGSFDSHQIVFSDGEEKTIKGVMIGEVWLASGQSNMEMPLCGWEKYPVAHSSEAIRQSGSFRSRLRLVTVPVKSSYVEQTQAEGLSWHSCTPSTAANFSAVGYYFAIRLVEHFKCPVGVIACAAGGTHVEAWMPRELLSTYPKMNLSQDFLEMIIPSARPMVMYNGMIHPLVGYTIRGFLWYQGESDVATYDRYAQRLTDLIQSWRGLWKNDKLPFLFVELAPYRNVGLARNRGPRLREAQWKVTDALPFCWMVSTHDLVPPAEAEVIHPSNKQAVGERLAALALGKVYAVKNEKCLYTRWKSMKVSGKRAILSFDNLAGGFLPNDTIRGFEVCGSDNIYHPAQARLEGNTIVVTSDKVSKPKNVCYGFQDYLPGNLKNRQGLPLVPFRTNPD